MAGFKADAQNGVVAGCRSTAVRGPMNEASTYRFIVEYTPI